MNYRTSIRQFSLAATLFAIASLFAACGDDGGDTEPDATPAADAGPGDATPKCAEATEHSDFTWVQENIFQKSCANFNQCHGNTGTRASLNLTAAMAYAELVEVNSVQVTNKKLVSPGSCADSYLFDKLTNNTAIMPAGDKSMPLNNPLLCQEKIDAVCRWIEAGAKND